MTAQDVLMIPDSRARQARARGNRLLEQHMEHLIAIQRRAMREKEDDIDALVTTITTLGRSITQAVRLYHQIWHEDPPGDDILATIHRILGLDQQDIAPEETP